VQTKAMSREHEVVISPSGLVTIVGGKWTTYRKMAEDTVDDAIPVGGLAERRCVTENLRLHGWVMRNDPALPKAGHMQMYGADAPSVQAFIGQEASRAQPLHARLPYVRGQVLWAVQHEMARTVEDVLARRTRSLLLDARAAIDATPAVAALMASELGRDGAWVAAQVDDFRALARGYLPPGAAV
jgi:glycerol-3-phosphate dehydrogenase